MAKADLGEKQVCPSCGAKFYDLSKRPAVCPKCQTAFDPQDEAVRMKRVRTRSPAYEDEDEKPEVEAEEEETVETVALDEGAVEAPEGTDGDEDEGPANSDEIPAGFSEDVGEDADAGAEEDDAVPILEDEEEEFSEDELGEIGDEGEDPPS